jgi:DNA polymerase-1
VSIQWVQAKLAVAAKTGYVTVAFGLRVRTPMLRQCVLGTKKTPYEATAEGRSAGNALGQSYGLLNSRAYMAFMKDVRVSPYRLDVKLCAQIHDAGYMLVRNDANVLAWVNKTLVPHVQWQELPEIQHDEVKLGGELSVFHPTWADELTIPNGADADQILSLAQEHMKQ